MQQDERPRISLRQLLQVMIQRGASDLHVTTGTPPQLRIDGSLVQLRTPPLGPVETKYLCYEVMTEEQKIKFEKSNELDFSFGVKGLSRFRANVFMQRGAIAGAFRAIPFKIRGLHGGLLRDVRVLRPIHGLHRSKQSALGMLARELSEPFECQRPHDC